MKERERKAGKESVNRSRREAEKDASEKGHVNMIKREEETYSV
jgi:hypothetical protein